MNNLELAKKIIHHSDAHNRTLLHCGSHSVVLTDEECRELSFASIFSYEEIRLSFGKADSEKLITFREQVKVARDALIDFIVIFAESTGIDKVARWLLHFIKPSKP